MIHRDVLPGPQEFKRKFRLRILFRLSGRLILSREEGKIAIMAIFAKHCVSLALAASLASMAQGWQPKLHHASKELLAIMNMDPRKLAQSLEAKPSKIERRRALRMMETIWLVDSRSLVREDRVALESARSIVAMSLPAYGSDESVD